MSVCLLNCPHDRNETEIKLKPNCFVSAKKAVKRLANHNPVSAVYVKLMSDAANQTLVNKRTRY